MKNLFNNFLSFLFCFVVWGIKPRALHILRKHCTTELHPLPRVTLNLFAKVLVSQSLFLQVKSSANTLPESISEEKVEKFFSFFKELTCGWVWWNVDNPTFSGGRGRRMSVQGQLWQMHKILCKNKMKPKKVWGHGSSGRASG
jgi:hypothetical protein